MAIRCGCYRGGGGQALRVRGGTGLSWASAWDRGDSCSSPCLASSHHSVPMGTGPLQTSLTALAPGAFTRR